MEKQNFEEPQKDTQSVMFRWILLILMAVAAKVLKKTEVMVIYTLVGKTVGHSSIVDGLHSELIGMMRFEKKDKKNGQK
jgi:hypothetical protein